MLFGFLILILGIGFKFVIFVLFFYVLLFILWNIYIGISEVDVVVKEVVLGIGFLKG